VLLYGGLSAVRHFIWKISIQLNKEGESVLDCIQWAPKLKKTFRDNCCL